MHYTYYMYITFYILKAKFYIQDEMSDVKIQELLSNFWFLT